MKVASYAFYRHPASGYESERAGEARGKFFINYLPTIVRAHASVFPDWQLRIHHDETVREFPYFRVLERLNEEGRLKLVPMGTANTLCGSMLWRLGPLWDEQVEHLVCRDVDSLPTPRERTALERWIGCGAAVHVIHDSESHMGIMGGTLGIAAQALKVEKYGDVDELLIKEGRGIDFNVHGSDQRFLGMWLRKEVRLTDTRNSLSQQTDPRDKCGGHARHIGGAYHAKPVRDFYDWLYPDDHLLAIEKELGVKV